MSEILVIDDDPQIRDLLRRLFEAKGHLVHEAPDGGEGLRVAMSNPVDLVICDLVMPGKEGMETIRELKAQKPELPIVAISGGSTYGGYDYLPLAIRMGADEGLKKPFLPDELISCVNGLLGPKA